MKKLSNTEAELKNSVAYEKACIANGWNGNQNLLTEQSNSFDLEAMWIIFRKKTKVKNDYYNNIIPAAFKSYNVEPGHLETLFLPFTVNELKLDSEIKNTASYSSFCRLIVTFYETCGK